MYFNSLKFFFLSTRIQKVLSTAPDQDTVQVSSCLALMILLWARSTASYCSVKRRKHISNKIWKVSGLLGILPVRITTAESLNRNSNEKRGERNKVLQHKFIFSAVSKSFRLRENTFTTSTDPYRGLLISTWKFTVFFSFTNSLFVTYIQAHNEVVHIQKATQLSFWKQSRFYKQDPSTVSHDFCVLRVSVWASWPLLSKDRDDLY